METAAFNECFDWIEKFHGKQGQLTDQVRAQWWERFGADHDAVFFEAAVCATEKMPPGMFPTIERMGQFVAEAREKQWQKVKEAEPKTPLSDLAKAAQAPDHRNTTHGRAAIRAILDVLEGRRDCIEAYEHMAAEWPGKGWEQTVAAMKQWKAQQREREKA